MTTCCRILKWDSHFFGKRIARIVKDRLNSAEMMASLDWCAEQGIDCLYFLCAPDDGESVMLAEANGFHLVDLRVELSWQPPATRASFIPAISIRQFQDADLPRLQQMAAQLFTDTRFYYDRNFPSPQAAALYQEWITKACQDGAQKVFIAELSNQVGGFITCDLDEPGTGRIGLMGVAEDVRGKGFGRELVWAAQDYLLSLNAAEVRVVTQGRNIAAQSLYQSCGFRTASLGLWYHKWFI